MGANGPGRCWQRGRGAVACFWQEVQWYGLGAPFNKWLIFCCTRMLGWWKMEFCFMFTVAVQNYSFGLFCRVLLALNTLFCCWAQQVMDIIVRSEKFLFTRHRFIVSYRRWKVVCFDKILQCNLHWMKLYFIFCKNIGIDRMFTILINFSKCNQKGIISEDVSKLIECTQKLQKI